MSTVAIPTTITLDNYMIASLANWHSIEQVEFDSLQLQGTHHHVSESGSVYFVVNDVVYRRSDHWNAAVAGCAWFIDGKTISRLMYGKCAIAEFNPMEMECAADLGLTPTSMVHLLKRMDKI